MIAAIVRSGVVENTIVLASLAIVSESPWLDFLSGADVVAVPAGEVAAPGYSYSPDSTPRFSPPES